MKTLALIFTLGFLCVNLHGDTPPTVLKVNGQIGNVVLTTTNISEGTNLYFTNARVYSALGTTYLKADGSIPLTSNWSLGNFKLTNLLDPTNPQDAATKNYVDTHTGAVAWGTITGTLSNQTDLQSALDSKEPTITAGTTLQYWRGDKSFQTLDTSVVPENTNLYFTNARAQGALSASLPLVDTAGVFSVQYDGTTIDLNGSNQLQALNITATSNSTLITLSALSLPYSQLTGAPAALTFADSLVNTSGTVTLVNDSASPSASQYYGTNGSSTLGFYSLPNSAVWGSITGTIGNQTDLAAIINVNGTQNLNAGIGAGISQTTANDNVNLGYNTGTLQTSGLENVNIGNQAGESNITGDYNVMIGNLAGDTNVKGYQTYIGSGAGRYQTGNGTNTDGAPYNVCVGVGACSGNTSGQTAWEITAIGDYAGYYLTSGDADVMLGTFAGENTTSGHLNIFVGDFDAYENTTGSRNTSMGEASFYFNSTGNDNTNVGYISLGHATGSFGTAIGSNALVNVTSGQNNTGIGYNTLPALTTGGDNTALGFQAGVGAGFTTLADDTFLGDSATSNANGVTNSTAIGYQATITASNQIMLGNGSVTAITTGNAAATYNGLVTNNSTVSGATVDAALNTLKAQLQSAIFSAIKNGGSVTANTEIPTWTTVNVDTLSAFNSSTGTYTVPSGLNGSNLIVTFNSDTTVGTPKGQIYHNGSLVQTCIGSLTQTGCSAYIANVATNDTVWVALDSSLTLTSTNTDTMFNISATSGGTVGQVVNARYHAATGTITSSLSNISFSTKDYDSASAYSAPTYTIPATTGAGVYHYDACVYLTATTTAANQVATCAVLDNGTIISESTQFLSSTTTKPIQCCVRDTYKFANSDAVTVQASLNGTTNSISASNVFNYFSIYKVSN